jgi:hypothetical protein
MRADGQSMAAVKHESARLARNVERSNIEQQNRT